MIGISVFAVLVMTVLISIPKANAEYPNILAGQNMTIGSTAQP
jgi:hypothetical protein